MAMMPFDLANLVLFFMQKRRKRMAKTKKLIWSVSKVVGATVIIFASVYAFMTYKKRRKIYAQPIRGFTSIGGESVGV